MLETKKRDCLISNFESQERVKDVRRKAASCGMDWGRLVTHKKEGERERGQRTDTEQWAYLIVLTATERHHLSFTVFGRRQTSDSTTALCSHFEFPLSLPLSIYYYYYYFNSLSGEKDGFSISNQASALLNSWVLSKTHRRRETEYNRTLRGFSVFTPKTKQNKTKKSQLSLEVG